MTLGEYLHEYMKITYSIKPYKGESLLEWAKIWFRTDNDTFFRLYGFNFNPHEYEGLYEIAREELYEKNQ